MNFFTQLFNAPNITQLEASQVSAMLAKKPKPYLLDVRTPDEYKQGHINGAELIPIDELSTKMGRLPKGREFVCVCASGSRSSMAARQLGTQGYKVSNLKGGMSYWVRAGLPVKMGMAK